MRHVGVLLRSVAVLLALALAAFALAFQVWWLAALFFATAVVIFPNHQFTSWSIKRRFRKSPHRNDDTLITLASEGLHGVATKGHSTLAWAAFTKARRFPDGFLLFQGPDVFNWLPDDALIDGSITTDADLAELKSAG